MTYDKWIPCIPPKVTAQQRKVSVVRGKPMFFKPKRLRENDENLKAILRPHAPLEPFIGAIQVDIMLIFPWRASEPKKNRINGPVAISTRPDLDNIFKNFGDVLTSLKFWMDDSQIADLRLRKFWGDAPGIRIGICNIYMGS
jgi:Holliday junction resolvase RusA-like endonuclease